MTEPKEQCCSYRDHFGDPEICPCPEHPRDELHVYGYPVKREHVREAVLRTIGTFTVEDPWVGGGADLAAADLVIEQVSWAVRHAIVADLRRWAAEYRNAEVSLPDGSNPSLTFAIRQIKAEALDTAANSLEDE